MTNAPLERGGRIERLDQQGLGRDDSVTSRQGRAVETIGYLRSHTRRLTADVRSADKEPRQNSTQNERGRHTFHVIVIFPSCNACCL
jgi:hypothetical protein